MKYFDVNRMVSLGYGTYVCFEDIVGVKCNGPNDHRRVDVVYLTGGHEFRIDMMMSAFEKEIARAIEQTMNDQNEHLKELEGKVKEEIVKIKSKSLYEKTDKISDAN